MVTVRAKGIIVSFVGFSFAVSTWVFAGSLLGQDQSAPGAQASGQEAPLEDTPPPVNSPVLAPIAPPSDVVRPDPEPITLPVGQVIEIRIADTISTNHNHTGDLFTGTVDPSVLVDRKVVIPRGTEAHIRLVDNDK